MDDINKTTNSQRPTAKGQQPADAEKHHLHDWLWNDFRRCGLYRTNKEGKQVLNQAAYSREIGLSESTLSRFWKHWDKNDNVVGTGTWERVRKYKTRCTGYVIVRTQNVEKVFNICNDALNLKRCLLIEGQSGYGKSAALVKYREYALRESINVYYVDAALAGAKPKRLISELMRTITTYKAGTITQQINETADKLKQRDALVIIDEVSALKNEHITVLKDLMSAMHGVAGLILAGTPYFMKTVKRKADRDSHLFKELKDRLFIKNTNLKPPSPSEAELIFQQNGLTPELVKIGMGRTGNPDHAAWSWTNKPTYRGIADVTLMLKDYLFNRETRCEIKPGKVVL